MAVSRRRGAPPRLPAGITLTSSGAYRARPTTGRRRTPKTFDDLDAAKAYLRAQELAGRSVAEALALWMSEDRPLSVKPTTLDRDKQIVRNLPSTFTSRDLASITFSEVTDVVGHWPGKDATRKRVRTTLQAFFRWCVRKGFLDESPARDIRVAATDPAAVPQPFSWAEVDDLAATVRVEHPYIADALLISAHTGVRAGELRALRVKDYKQLPSPHLEVSRSHTETQAEENSTKSGKARFIPLDPTAAVIVSRLAAHRCPDDYLLVTPTGAQVRVRNMQRQMGWHRLAPGHKWHDLRHTAAVEWVQRSDVISTADIQRLLGHAALSTTERYLAGLSGTIWHTQISAAFQSFEASPRPTSWHTGGAA